MPECHTVSGFMGVVLDHGQRRLIYTAVESALVSAKILFNAMQLCKANDLKLSYRMWHDSVFPVNGSILSTNDQDRMLSKV